MLKLFKKVRVPKHPNLHKPYYAEVFTALTSNQISRCFVAYEVMLGKYSELQTKLAEEYLQKVASSHNWYYQLFMDIIIEEYGCIHHK